MTKADRQALRDKMAGPKVEWGRSNAGWHGAALWQGQKYLLCVWTDRVEWFVEIRRVGEREVLFTGRFSSYPDAVRAAETWLADHLIPNRRKTLDLLDWADKVETWVKGLGRARWTPSPDIPSWDYCTACGRVRSAPGPRGGRQHDPACPFGDEYAELFGKKEET
jgi:hypothetical protein